ncbi:hypothetical protein [Paenibacillus cremeus]|uniref:DUF4357 domain-containing protein n=1 Tax=Paenibacillus cremeus TaxID=2163881 RepID=A0A559JHN4_9BACL|nr:hypothetical protein [Paenibacillus cremeus]TVX99378.1 hypothetical protein FPZ49_33935 [Paenibacillus cremeus]
MLTIKAKLKPAPQSNLTANIFLNDATGVYDSSAGIYERVVLLPGSILAKHDTKGWIYRDLESLVRSEHVEKIGNQYKVLKPIVGSTSGTAAAVLGEGVVPNGFDEWKLATGKSINESGER